MKKEVLRMLVDGRCENWRARLTHRNGVQITANHPKATATSAPGNAAQNLAERLLIGHNKRAQYSPAQTAIASAIKIEKLGENIYIATYEAPAPKSKAQSSSVPSVNSCKTS